MSGRRAPSRRPLTVIVTAAAVVTLLGVGGAVIFRLGVLETADPSTRPSASASHVVAEERPAEKLDPTDRLPRSDDLVFQGNDWTEGDTYISAGPAVPDAACITAAQLNRLVDTGRVGRRDFTGSQRESRFTAWVLEYPTPAEAKAAAATIEEHTTGCMQIFRRPSGPHEVSTAVGTGRYYEALTTVEGSGESAGEDIWNSVGVIRSGSQVAVLSLTFHGAENHFEHDPDSDTGLPLHPMQGMLPNAAARLA